MPTVVIDGTNVDGVDVSAHAVATTGVHGVGASTIAKVSDLAAYVTKALFDADSILAATADDTPAALVLTAQTLVGMITGGHPAALSVAQCKTLLNWAADIATHAALTATHGAAYIVGATVMAWTGTGLANKAIAHGLGRVPKLIFGTDSAAWFMEMASFTTTIFCEDSTSPYARGGLTVTAMDATNFYVGNAGNYYASANVNGYGYYFVAIGQVMR